MKGIKIKQTNQTKLIEESEYRIMKLNPEKYVFTIDFISLLVSRLIHSKTCYRKRIAPNKSAPNKVANYIY